MPNQTEGWRTIHPIDFLLTHSHKDLQRWMQKHTSLTNKVLNQSWFCFGLSSDDGIECFGVLLNSVTVKFEFERWFLWIVRGFAFAGPFCIVETKGRFYFYFSLNCADFEKELIRIAWEHACSPSHNEKTDTVNSFLDSHVENLG